MRVLAIKEGFFRGVRRREGAEFEVLEGTTSKWFVPVSEVEAVDDTAGARKGKGKKGKGDEGPSTFSEVSKLDAATIPGTGADALV